MTTDEIKNNNVVANENADESVKQQRLKAEIEKQKQLKARREADVYKRKYFEFYDDIKISHREDW